MDDPNLEFMRSGQKFRNWKDYPTVQFKINYCASDEVKNKGKQKR